MSSTLPASRSIRWRRSCSPSSASRMRSTRLRSRWRLVIRPGGVRQPAELGERGAALEVDEHEAERRPASAASARPATSVRSSSLLPEPVAPTISPCGPMPPSADCLRSSTTRSPSSAIADRHAQLRAARPRRQVSRGSHLRPASRSRAARAGAHVVAPAPRAGAALLQPQRRERAGERLRQAHVARVGPDALPARGRRGRAPRWSPGRPATARRARRPPTARGPGSWRGRSR